MGRVSRSADLLLQQLIARQVLERFVDDLASASVLVMPLKGVLLVALGVRPATERGTIDVDLLVSSRDTARALTAARERGWVVEAGNETACSLRHPSLPMPIDLHRSLFPPHQFALATEAVLARGSRDRSLFGGEVLRMHPLDIYAHLIGHFAKSRADQRDQRHVSDFAAIGKWLQCAPAECARHLAAHGLSRAARFALRSAQGATADTFGCRVLDALPRDLGGEVIVRTALVALARLPQGSPLGMPIGHLLNADLRSATRSAAAHIIERRARGRLGDAWWLLPTARARAKGRTT